MNGWQQIGYSLLPTLIFVLFLEYSWQDGPLVSILAVLGVLSCWLVHRHVPFGCLLARMGCLSLPVLARLAVAGPMVAAVLASWFVLTQHFVLGIPWAQVRALNETNILGSHSLLLQSGAVVLYFLLMHFYLLEPRKTVCKLPAEENAPQLKSKVA